MFLKNVKLGINRLNWGYLFSMKKLTIVILLVIAGSAIWGFSLNEPTPDDEKLLLTLVENVLKQNHYSKLRIDDSFSERVFDLYIKRMDYNKMYFTEKDVKDFEEYRHKLDEAILKPDLEFYHLVTETFAKRLKETESISEKLLNKDFDFEQSETYETDPDKRTYAKNDKDLEEIWRKYLKYNVLNSYLGKLENQEKAIEKGSDSTGAVIEIKTEEELMEAAVESTKKNMKTRFKRRSEVDEEDNFAFYINALSGAYDPHTQYFPPQEKENFDMRMTGRLEGIGAVLQEADGYIKINSIVTGSACWRQGDLEVGDLILKVAQGNGEPEDIVDAAMKEVLKLIRGPKGTEVQLTVQKKDGQITVIPIIRDVVIREETYAKSAVIEDSKTNRKYGYLYLPGFYARFGERDGRSSAEDVEAELEKLKLEKVEGIVLDLRNNGGGSLNDAVEMAGLFIKDGPIVQVKTTGQRSQVKSDYNSNITYEGPLIIMINSFSASASEIVSAALKDYGRAYIVGSPSSYGKGTVQTFADLNRYIKPGIQLENPFGSLKFTIQQFYRINGSSTQYKGVKPDVQFPEVYDIKEIGESSLDYSIPWDSIPSVGFAPWKGLRADISNLRSGSENRIREEETFRKLNERIKWMNAERNETEISLFYDDVRRKRDERKEMTKEFDEIKTVNEDLLIKSLQEIAVLGDTVAETRIANWEKQISKDFYLHETLDIMHDIISQMNVPTIAEDHIDK